MHRPTEKLFHRDGGCAAPVMPTCAEVVRYVGDLFVDGLLIKFGLVEVAALPDVVLCELELQVVRNVQAGSDLDSSAVEVAHGLEWDSVVNVNF
jgi:hypothetical protein